MSLKDVRPLCVLRRSRLRGGKRADDVLVAQPSGAVAIVSVSTPIIMPPFDPSYLERFVRWIARTCLVPRARAVSEVPVMVRAMPAGSSVILAKATPLPVACAALCIPTDSAASTNAAPTTGGANAYSRNGASHILILDAPTSSAALYAIASSTSADVRSLGCIACPSTGKACALAAHPTHTAAYVLSDCDGLIHVLSLSADSPLKVAARVALPAGGTSAGGKPPSKYAGGAICVSADGACVYVLLAAMRPRVHVLTARSPTNLEHVGTISVPAALSASDADDDDGRAASAMTRSAPAIALTGPNESLLVIVDNGRLLTYPRDVANGMIAPHPLHTMPMEDPCALVPFRWP